MATLIPTPIPDSDLANRPVTNSDMLHYNDGVTYDYYCYAVPGLAANVAGWYVVRVAKDDSQVAAALPAGYFHLATDLAAVQALTFRT
jgi:hypothetical protein